MKQAVLICMLLAACGSTAHSQSSAAAPLRAVQTYSGHRGPVEGIAFSPDGQKVVVVASQTAHVLDSKTFQLLRSFPLPTYLTRITWPSEGVLRLDGRGKVLLVNSTNGQKLEGRQYGSSVGEAVSSRAGLVAVNEDRAIALYDASTGLLARRIEHGQIVLDAFDLSPDGRRLVIADSSLGARLYNAESGAVIRVLADRDDWASAARFSPDGKTLTVATGLSNDEARLLTFDAEDGQPTGEYSGVPESLDTLTIGSRTLAGADYGDVFVFDRGQEELRYRFAGFGRSTLTLGLSLDDSLLGYGSWFGDVRFASLSTGKVIKSLSGFPGADIWCLKVSPDGRRVLTCGYDRTARVYDLETGRAIASLEGHDHWVSEGLFVPGGGLVTLSDTTIHRWSSQGQKLGTWTTGADQVEQLTVHPSGKYLAYAIQDYEEEIDDIVIREVATGRIVARLPMADDSVMALAFHPGGKILTSLHSSGTVMNWNWATGDALTRAVRGSEYGRKLAYDPQGQRLALSSPQEGVSILDAATLRPVQHIPLSRVYDFDFGAQGQQLIVRSEGTVTLFDVRTGKVNGRFAVHPYGDIVVTPDGKGLLLDGGPVGSPTNATLYRAPEGGALFR